MIIGRAAAPARGGSATRPAARSASIRRSMRAAMRASSLALGALLLAPSPARAQDAAAPLVMHDDRGRAVQLVVPARRLVSLLPSLTETVCALGACARLVGVDRHSDWPAAVRSLPRLGGLEDTQIERLVALAPDLVLAALSARAVDRLEALGVPVLALEPRSRAETRRTIATVARALGEPAAGAALVAQIDARIAAAAARVPQALRGRSVYVEVAATPHAAGAASFIGETLAQLGLVNIVPAALGPFPQLSPEFVLRAQPALVVAPAQVLAEMPRRPGWNTLAALRERRHCGLAPAAWDALVRAGPRLADAAEAIAECLQGLPR